MNLSVVYQPAVSASTSAYRVRDNQGGELDWANAFLDGQRLRQLSPRSLRIYAYDLLDFARWFEPQHRPFAEITESTIVDYVRHQLEQDPKPASQTVNHRLGTVRCCYRFHTGQEIPAGQVHFQRRYTRRSPLGYGRLRTTVARGLRLKQDRPVIVPLSAEEVAKFWQSFRTYRDLALVGLMLLDGCAPARSWPWNWKTCNSLTARCASAAKETKSASCRCRRIFSKSWDIICATKGH